MPYLLGEKSQANLVSVHPDLVKIVRRAIELTASDFQVFEGVRSRERQAKLLATGASRTLDSRHLLGPDGFGHAVDLVPIIDGQLSWHWPACYAIAQAVRQASMELRVPVRWGGVWDRLLADIQTVNMCGASTGYTTRRKELGKPVFLDGPHFELPVGQYQ